MKIFLTISLLVSYLISYGQDTIYLDKNLENVKRSQAEYYRIIHKGTKVPDIVIKETFFLSGQRESLAFSYYDPIKKIEDTISFHLTKKWFKNGNLKSIITLRNGKFSDTLTTYWQNGNMKRKDYFIDGNFINGRCYDSLGSEIKHFDYEIMPQYPGGDQKLLQFVASHTEYPVKSRDAGIQGRVIVRFKVREDGTVDSLYILQGVNSELNNEAIRVIGQLAQFQPGLVDGEPVPVYYMVPITFTLR